ncbi:DMT family transporter [Chloroflexota bacterium]|nr:DMT family transporter [Chloroflexota bacterium]
MDKQRRFGIFAALVAALLFGAAAPLGKPLLTFLTDLQLAGLLYLGAALGVLLILLRERPLILPWRMPKRDALRLAGAILFGGLLGPVLLLAGLRIAAAASVSLWLNMEMTATVIIGVLFFKDHLSGRGWLAAIGVLAAAVLMAWTGGVAGFQAGGLVALACICWGVDNHLTALIDGITPAQSTFWKGIAAGSVNLALGLIAAPIQVPPLTLAAALGLGAVSYGLSILLYITAAQNLGAIRSQLIFSGAPFFGLLFSILLGDILSWLQWIALIVFAGSVYLLFRETHSHLHHHDPVTHVHTHFHPDQHHDHDHPEGEEAIGRHSHEHTHSEIVHSHPHWPDLHHRHEHG